MREPERDKQLLANIVEAIDFATDFVGQMSYEDFTHDKRTYFAVVKNIEIIGEAAYQLTIDFKNNHPEVEWKVIINMRHVLVHGYADIVPSVLWETIKNDLQPLKEHIQRFIAQM